MAENKKSVILYVDLINTFEELSDDEAGRLIKHFFRYVNDKNPEPPDRITKIAFEPIKQQLKRDLVKWENKKSKRSEAGHIGGLKSGESRRSKQTKANEANDSNVKQTEANEAVNVNGNVNVNVIGNTADPHKDSLFFDAEAEVLKNQIQFERICMSAKKPDLKAAKESLRKFHLYLEANAKYPQTRKQIFAGFEKWLLSEKHFIRGQPEKEIPAHMISTGGPPLKKL